MAEGLLRTLAGDRFEAASAGTEKTSVNPLAIEAMERGIDITAHTSKVIEGLMQEPWDYLVTGCTGRSRIPRGRPEVTRSASPCSAGCGMRSRPGSPSGSAPRAGDGPLTP